MNKKSPLSAFLTAIMIGICALAGTLDFGTVQASTNVINSDTTWTSASLTGPVYVNEGVTLTIQAGATVNLDGNYIEVAGTLRAIGSSADPIHLNGGHGEIRFKESSSNWNDQTGSGCIIEKVILSRTSISISSSPKINNNTIDGPQARDVIYIHGGSPLILNNDITGGLDSRAIFNIQGGSPVISNNKITARVDNGLLGVAAPDWDLSHMNRFGTAYGVHAANVDGAYISDNIFSRFNGAAINVYSGSATIENNLIINNYGGILIGSNAYVILRDNTFIDTPTNTSTSNTPPSPTPTPSPTPIPTTTPAPSPIPVPGQSFFFVESNSIVSELFFNSTSSELSFTVSGTSGTAGYVKVTIAKSLLSSVQNVKVYLDGRQLDVAITSDEDSWLLSFNYVHSTHHVRISLATEAATTFLGIEFWIGIGVSIIIVVIGVGLLVYFKKRKH